MKTNFAQVMEEKKKFDDDFMKKREEINNMFRVMEGLDREVKKSLNRINENNEKLRNILDRF
jgi:hypothetical protein